MSGRKDLFQQEGVGLSARVDGPGAGAGESKGQQPGDGVGEYANDGGSPLQLEHILGYAGQFRGNCVMIPDAAGGGPQVFAKAIGSLLVVENLQDAHDQKLLRGHDSPISALAVSASGSYLASGQMGTEKYRGRAAPIFIWDPFTKKRLSVLKGLTTRVNAIAFSMDERFVCGCGEVSAAHNHLPLSHITHHISLFALSPYTHRIVSSTCGTCRQPRPSPASAYSPQPTW